MAATLRDVAEMANVSIATVSMVVNNKADRIADSTKKRVQEAIKTLGYSPNLQARWLQNQKSSILAILVPELDNSFFSSLAQSAIVEAQKHGWMLSIFHLPSEEQQINSLKEKLSSGSFAGTLITSRKFEELHRQIYKNRKVPYVLLDESVKTSKNQVLVTCDNYKGGYLLAEHLINNGHRKLACITGPEDTPNSMRRLAGFIKRMNEESLVLESKNIVTGDYSLKSGYDMIQKLDLDNITAIFAMNDLMALGAMRYLIEKGYRIPEDISIVGYDNLDVSEYIFPRLTTIDQHVDDLGREGVLALLDKIEGNERGFVKFIEPSLVKGGTVKKIN